MRWLPLLILLAPLAGAEIMNPEDTAEATLYMHLVRNGDLAMNLVPPPEGWTYSHDRGIVHQSQGCVEVPGVGLASTTQHTYYAYVMQGAYDYESTQQEPARGLHRPLSLATNQTVHVDWMLHASYASLGVSAPTASYVTVRATLREGSAISVGHQAMDQGIVLALGETPQTLIAGPATETQDWMSIHATPTGTVYAFSVPLAWAGPDQVSTGGFNLRMDTFVAVPGCDDPGADRYVMPDGLHAHTSPGLRPALHLPYRGSVVVEHIETFIQNGTARAEAHVTTPWGPYNLGEVRLTGVPWTAVNVTDPARWKPEAARVHTWTWHEPGDFELNVTVQDAQGHGQATANMPFEMGAKSTTCRQAVGSEVLCHSTSAANKDSPAGLVLLPLLLAAFARRTQ